MIAEPAFFVQPAPSIPLTINIPKGGSSRIPDALKLIFLQAWTGEVVDEAPADGCAFKLFDGQPQVDPAQSKSEVEVTVKPSSGARPSSRPIVRGETTTKEESFSELHPQQQEQSLLPPSSSSSVITGRRERFKLKGRTLSRRSMSPPPLPQANGNERFARRRSNHGDDNRRFFNRSNHGDDNKRFFGRLRHGDDNCTNDDDDKRKCDVDSQKGPLMKGLGFLGERFTRATSNSADEKKKTDEQHKKSANLDRKKQTGPLEMGFNSVHGTSDATQETEDSSSRSEEKRTFRRALKASNSADDLEVIRQAVQQQRSEPEDSLPRSEVKQRRVRKQDLKASRSADDLEAMRQAVQQQSSKPEGDPLEACSTHSAHSKQSIHSKQSMGGGESAYPSQRSPQVFLDVMLRTRGYSTETRATLETSYFNSPTELQMASYHARLQHMLRAESTCALKEILTCGVSPNPCNSYGESLLHTACRNGYDASVRCMLEDCGTSVQVSDNCGRTPLHSAFFGTTPSYEIVERLVKRDRHLLHLKDRHGATPLSYIPRDHWGMWIDFFYSNRDQFWPRRNKRFDGVAESGEKMNQKPNSAPLPDPSNALPKDMAAMVASGKLTPEEAMDLMETGDDDTNTAGDSTAWSDSFCSDTLTLNDSQYADATSVSSATMLSARGKPCNHEDDYDDGISVVSEESFA